MRNFTSKEKKIIKDLDLLCVDKSITVRTFLEKILFKEKSGKALIIQTVNNYAVLYLKKEIYDNENHRKRSLQDFLEIIMLFKFLKKQHYISLIPPSNRIKKKMYFFQKEFHNPEFDQKKIVLNEEGQYTSDPEFIYNSKGEIIYKGVFLEAGMYDSIESDLISELFVLDSFKQLLQENPKEKKTSKRNYLLAFITPLIYMIIVGIPLYLLYQNQVKYSFKSEKNQVFQKKKLRTINQKLSQIKNLLEEEPSNDIEEVMRKDLKEYCYGIDISRYNTNVIEKLAMPDSIQFVIVKATEGMYYVDPYFKTNWKNIKEMNLVRGAYHFFNIWRDPIKQANHYLNTVGSLDENDITPIIDVEDQSLRMSDKDSISKLQDRVLKFVEHIEKKTNHRPMIYTGKYFANKYLNNEKFSKYHLWIAQYTNRGYPNLPKTWKNEGYKLWQKTDNYNLYNIRTDLNLFYGTKEELTEK